MASMKVFLALLVVIAVIGGVIFLSQSKFSLPTQKVVGGESLQPVNFCTELSQCKNFLRSQGFTDDKINGMGLTCSEGKCYLKGELK